MLLLFHVVIDRIYCFNIIKLMRIIIIEKDLLKFIHNIYKFIFKMSYQFLTKFFIEFEMLKAPQFSNHPK